MKNLVAFAGVTLGAFALSLVTSGPTSLAGGC